MQLAMLVLPALRVAAIREIPGQPVQLVLREAEEGQQALPEQQAQLVLPEAGAAQQVRQELHLW